MNRRNYLKYQECLSGLPGVFLFPYKQTESHNYQYVVVEIDESITQVSRDSLMQVLHVENVIARRYFYPGCHRMEPYKSYFPHAGLLLPETEKLVERILILPTGTAVSVEDIANICEIIKLALGV